MKINLKDWIEAVLPQKKNGQNLKKELKVPIKKIVEDLFNPSIEDIRRVKIYNEYLGYLELANGVSYQYFLLHRRMKLNALKIALKIKWNRRKRIFEILFLQIFLFLAIFNLIHGGIFGAIVNFAIILFRCSTQFRYFRF